MRKGQGGKKKELIDCVQSDVRAFGVSGDSKATALKAGVWYGQGAATLLFIMIFSLFSRPQAGLATVESSFFRVGNQ